MSTPKDNDFAERRSAALLAKQAMLEKFKTKPDENDPAVQAKLSSMGFQQHRRTLDESAAYVKDEVIKWGAMVKAIDLKVEQ